MSEIRTQMLDDLSSAGMAGLTLWPEDLRHPFSLLPDKPMLSPDDLAGLNFRMPSSEASNTLFSSLGAIPMFADSGYEAGESGLSQGASLSGAPIFSGNITFFAKYQVLFANSAAIEKLSEEQRAVLREAAAATQKKAIAEHPSDVEAGAAWCADGGSIVLASDTQVAAFEKATQPVFDSMKQNPLNAELIAAIRELKANTQPSARAQACVPDIAQQSSDTNTETEVWSEGLPPNGVWQVEVTTEELVQMGLRRSIAEEWAGVTILTLQDGKGKYDWSSNTEIYIYSCLLDYVVVGNNVHLTYSAYSASVNPDECEGVVEDLQWRLDDDGLHFHLLAAQNAPFAEDKASWEAKPFQKIADQ